jgi:hypothetical protein
MVFTISRTQAGIAERVNFTLTGTATSGVDYTPPANLYVDFLAADTSKQVTIPVATDLVNDAAETIIMTLTSIVNTSRLTTPVGTGTITDLTAAPVYTVAVSGSPTAEAGSAMTFTITRTTTGLAQTANFTLTGTATEGVDYTTSASTSVSFAAGDTSKTVTITPLSDTNYAESDETVILTLTSITGSGTGSVGSPGSATGTITNVVTYAYWDNANKGTGSFAPVLANVNSVLRSVKPSAGGQRGTVRGNAGKSSGKWYFELKLVSGTDGNFGMSLNSVSLNQDMSGVNNTFQIVIFNGNVYVNGSLTSGVTPRQPGVYFFALDRDAGKVYVGTCTTAGASVAWANSANPDAGTGGITWNPSGAVFFDASPYWSGSQTEVQVNCGQDAFIGPKNSVCTTFNPWTI